MAKTTALCGLLAGILISLTTAAQVTSSANYAVFEDTITFTVGATDADMAVLDTHPEFKTITIGGGGAWSGRGSPRNVKWPLTNAGIAHLASCPNLLNLRINTPYTTDLTDDGLKVLEKLPKLRTLDLREQRFSDAGLKHLAALHDLEELQLDGNPNLSDGTLQTVATLKKLRVLRFFQSPLTDAGISKIAALSELENLQLGYAHIGDDAMKTIATFKKLKTLDLQNTQLTDAGLAELKNLNPHWLCLKNTRITTLTPLAAMNELEWLSVAETQITDASLETLLSLKSLKVLDLSKTALTPAAIRRLEQKGIDVTK